MNRCFACDREDSEMLGQMCLRCDALVGDETEWWRE